MEKADFKGHLDGIQPPTISENQPQQNMQQTFDVDEVWKSVKEQLRLYISDTSIKTWYPNVYLERIEAGIAEITCDTQYKREWIDTNNRAILKKLLLSTTGQNLEIVVTLSAKQPTKSADAKYEYYDPSQASLFSNTSTAANVGQASFTPGQNKTETNSSLNNRYTFKNFIVGSGNQMAFAVAEAVSDNPGTSYNPVFYYGGTGVGKTHLMLAIGNKILEKDPTKKIIYSPIEKFLNELISAIRKKQNEEFRKKYRDVDVLIIDDIQFVGNYPKTQDEIFNTFNELYLANKQIIMASDRLPRDIPNITDRLRSRFQGGMVVDIQSPDLETRIAIVQQKVDESGMQIPFEVVDFIANNIESNIRELEGAITKVISHTKFTKRIPSQEEIENMLQIDIDSKRKRIKPHRIIEVVAEQFEVHSKEIRGQKRNADIALARQVVMFLLREELKLPLEKVAQEVNRQDHTTVIHACEKIREMLSENGGFKEKVDKCRRLMKE